MADRLPPLTALRAFEAAARHLSFQDAARELNVTPAALSFQIKSLEAHLGEPVFRRLNRAVELTPIGKSLAPGVSEGFARLSEAWQSARRSQDTRSLTVTAGPAFTTIWLAPRLYDFARAHPEIDLNLAASLRIMHFSHENIDAAIRFGVGEDEDLFSHHLMDEWLTPVMTPELARHYRSPDDLLQAPLIFDDSIAFLEHRPGWESWFSLHDLHPSDLHGTRFSNADHAIESAAAGGGVLLARMSLAARAVLSGRLVSPFRTGLRAGASFRFVCPNGTQAKPAIAAFLAWIVAETRVVTDLSGGHDIVDP